MTCHYVPNYSVAEAQDIMSTTRIALDGATAQWRTKGLESAACWRSGLQRNTAENIEALP